MQFRQSGKSLLHIDNPFRSMDFESNHTQLRRRTPMTLAGVSRFRLVAGKSSVSAFSTASSALETVLT